MKPEIPRRWLLLALLATVVGIFCQVWFLVAHCLAAVPKAPSVKLILAVAAVLFVSSLQPAEPAGSALERDAWVATMLVALFALLFAIARL